jgi:hypothetical protein
MKGAADVELTVGNFVPATRPAPLTHEECLRILIDPGRRTILQSGVFSRNVAEVSQELGRRFARIQLPVVGVTGHEPGDSPMRKLLFAGAMLASCAAIQSATAADLALKAPPPPPIVDEWTGWYVGLNLGGSWGRSSTTYTGAGVGLVPFTTSQHLDGVLGGGQNSTGAG